MSAAYAEADGGLPVVSSPVLREYAYRDLVVLLGPASEPVRALSAGRPDVTEQLLAPWRELADERLRLETVHLGQQGTGHRSLRPAARTLGLAGELGVRSGCRPGRRTLHGYLAMHTTSQHFLVIGSAWAMRATCHICPRYSVNTAAPLRE
ncbi:hypothetical protein HEP85_44820 [Streptomyces sp. RPA4-2]|uniref:hypothetical protein n=1 Tax=Streptomyces sp. RPA4-2 TaxID=2721244 RepID=UPI002001DBC7|nr:hypothetical protein [Streptomyces sp. RPA4-2]